jgi:hypothetical protein
VEHDWWKGKAKAAELGVGTLGLEDIVADDENCKAGGADILLGSSLGPVSFTIRLS